MRQRPSCPACGVESDRHHHQRARSLAAPCFKDDAPGHTWEGGSPAQGTREWSPNCPSGLAHSSSALLQTADLWPTGPQSSPLQAGLTGPPVAFTRGCLNAAGSDYLCWHVWPPDYSPHSEACGRFHPVEVASGVECRACSQVAREPPHWGYPPHHPLTLSWRSWEWATSWPTCWGFLLCPY